MQKNALLFGLAALWSLSLFSCSDDREIPDVSDIQVDFEIHRIDRELWEIRQELGVMRVSEDSEKEEIREHKSLQPALELLNKYPEFAEVYLRRSNYPNDSVLARQLTDLATYEYSDTLFMDTERIFGELKDTKEEFVQAFKFLKYYYPEEKIPDLYTLITGFGNYGFGGDMSLNEQLIVISLDYFLGETATYRPSPQQVPGYILDRYDQEHLVPNIMTLYSRKFNQSEFKDRTLLAEMIYYGKAYYFTQQVMPYTADSTILGYTGQDLANLSYNETKIYAHFVENNLFYENSQRTISKYVGERPKTTEIDSEAPGRIGRWLGLQIVTRYMEQNPEVTLPQLMSNTRAQDIFQKSKYKPRKGTK